MDKVEESTEILLARSSFIIRRHSKDVIAGSPLVIPRLAPRSFGNEPAERSTHVGTRTSRSSGGSEGSLIITIIADMVPAM